MLNSIGDEAARMMGRRWKARRRSLGHEKRKEGDEWRGEREAKAATAAAIGDDESEMEREDKNAGIEKTYPKL